MTPNFTDSPSTAPAPRRTQNFSLSTLRLVPQWKPSAHSLSAIHAADFYSKYCHQAPKKDAVLPCALGDTEVAFTIAIGENSRAAQWAHALEKLGEDHRWRVYATPSCLVSSADVVLSDVPYDSCSRWNIKTLEHLTGAQCPNFVLINSSVFQPAGATTFADGLTKTRNGLKEATVPFAVIKDSPKPSGDVAQGVSVNPELGARSPKSCL